MKTIDKLKYLENLLKSKGCPTQDITPYAVQILGYCKANNKSVYNFEIIK
jgi:hypothetical protein